MATLNKESHGAFYVSMALLGAAGVGVGIYLYSQDSTVHAQDRTLQLNPPSHQDPDKKIAPKQEPPANMADELKPSA